MSDQNQSKRLVVQLPKSLFSKVEEAASRDYTSVSDICRRALASDLPSLGAFELRGLEQPHELFAPGPL